MRIQGGSDNLTSAQLTELFGKNGFSVILDGAEETHSFGIALASVLKKGDVVALTGDLGCGKTTLTQAVAEGLGIHSHITSPTFTIVQEYDEGCLPLYHFDVYRIHDEDELFEAGFEEYFAKGGVCMIEWADLIESLIPENAVRIRIEYSSGGSSRLLTYESAASSVGKYNG